jgi:S1-C subfamily serine protease
MPDGLVGVADSFRAAVGGSSFPRVFAGLGPERISPVDPPDPGEIGSDVVRRARSGIVKITGEAASCSRGQEGSGMVVATGRVVTNAHVVAGVRRPRVQVAGTGRRYPARVVLFDARRDLAVLAVPSLGARPLPLGEDLERGDPAVVGGFPNDGPFKASAARVRSVITAAGEDIYGKPGAERQVYSLYVTVRPGNSGGPVVDAQGRVVGVVFAKSLEDKATGYALTMAEAGPVIAKGVAATRSVGTGACAVG